MWKTQARPKEFSKLKASRSFCLYPILKNYASKTSNEDNGEHLSDANYMPHAASPGKCAWKLRDISPTHSQKAKNENFGKYQVLLSVWNKSTVPALLEGFQMEQEA
jgi:hypothetical protein